MTPSAYRTRTKPAYCLTHVDDIFRRGGLEPIGTFHKPEKMRRCRCLACAVEADYRMVTVEERTDHRETACDACRWRAWAETARATAGRSARTTPNDLDAVAKLAQEHFYVYIRPLTDPSLPDDPHLTECERCGVRSVQRVGDMGFVCGCTKSRIRTAPPRKKLFKDSGSPALDWWAEDNDAVLLATATMKANREADWICPKGHRFTAPIRTMSETPRCGECAEEARLSDMVRIQAIAHLTISQVSELAETWDDPAYDPAQVMVLDDRPTFGVGFRWKCPNGHHPRLSISRWYLHGCDHCAAAKTRSARAGVVNLEPEIANQYAERNSTPIEKVTPGSSRPRWWKDPVCGHEWEASPRERMQQPVWRCPICRTRTNSFGWNYPELAEEWADTNPVTPFHVLPTGRMDFTPEWVCAHDSAHRWSAPLTSRVNGAGCPDCRVSGKSKVEVLYLAAAAETYGEALSGRTVRHEAFRRRGSWTVDILVGDVAIEYDGAYWHADKVAVDTDKSLDLLAAGLKVIRLREHPLPLLQIDDPLYAEFTVYASAPDPAGVIQLIAARFGAPAVSRQ
ncbi:zinc-ribbon domain-containing protein [Microbacterium aquimaris]|uniref:Zinc-ribbon domain-containing protein n=1 Tax=Microbacterium aquimaris TaxID=459816 RepID=A0ABU5N428_9MICO|nr:zinc-ribbon domain-containing protein [Microbacterium aquimaris]MDZ8160850.1 zinc-ribbon domain-containing protein [Microbacterium aquimaris]